MTHDALSKVILDSAFRIHSVLGPGLFENVYEVIMAYELRKQHLQVARQVPIPSCTWASRKGIGLSDPIHLDRRRVIRAATPCPTSYLGSTFHTAWQTNFAYLCVTLREAALSLCAR